MSVSCVVTLCKRGIESRMTELLLVESVKVSLVEPVLVDPDSVDQSMLFALLETLAVHALAAGKLFGALLPPSEVAYRLGQTFPAPILTNIRL